MKHVTMKASPAASPVLSCKQALELEAVILGDEAAGWAAMQAAGRAIAQQVEHDFHELSPWPQAPRVLALIGKGHNGGDALIACGHLLADFPRTSVTLILTQPVEQMKPLAQRAYAALEGRVMVHQVDGSFDQQEVHRLLDSASGGAGYAICLDGLLGMSFAPPLREPMRTLIQAINAYCKIGLRAAVDLPSGKGDASDLVSFQADFSYATGVVKQVLLEGIAECGRVRYIDLGFFETPQGRSIEATERVLNDRVLDPLRALRPAWDDKRAYGHLFVVGGSASMPGALLMAVQAAVRSGVGLVTAFAPASLAASLSAQVPEAMWVPWPETANGTLNPRAMPLLFDRIDQATAVLVGPGMGQDRNTEMVAQDLVRQIKPPVIMDADALRPRVVELVPTRKPTMGPVVLTPHMGEFMRIARLTQPDYSNDVLQAFCRRYHVMTVLKAAHTRICDAESLWYNICGGGVLARGGSGDVLAGLMAGMVAQDAVDTSAAVARGVVLHGLAAQQLARQHGQVLVHTTQLLDYLTHVLRRM
jgi:hydroxyethylthiazole kinase-like uncharacterized protein yjeF